MSHVAVQKSGSDKAESQSLIEKMEALTEQIRLRAFELFKSRGGGDGLALDDWLAAENSLLLRPESAFFEVTETQQEFNTRFHIFGASARPMRGAYQVARESTLRAL